MEPFQETHTKTKFCANCGKQNPTTYNYCIVCGYAIPDIDFFPQNNNTQPQSDREQKQQPSQSIIYAPTVAKKRGYGWLIFSLTLALIIVFYLVVNKPNVIRNGSPKTTADTSHVNVIQKTQIVSTKDELFNAKDIILIVDNKQIPLSNYPDEAYLAEHKSWRTYNFSDVDGDDIPELLTEYFTGGAHCCFVYNFFQQVSKNTYKCVFTFEGGEGSVKINNEKLEVSFYEQLGYFYACYACSMDKELPNGYFRPYFNLVFRNKKLYYDEEDAYLNRTIIEDLEFLKNRELPNLDSSGFDDGTRKSYAEHIIAYFFNNGQNINSTKEIFEKYYLGSDSTEIWNLIIEHINGIFNMQFASEQWLKNLDK